MLSTSEYTTGSKICEQNTNQLTDKCYTSCSNPNIENFQVGGGSVKVQVDNLKLSEIKSMPQFDEVKFSKCDNDQQCVIFNDYLELEGDIINGKYSVAPELYKCTDPVKVNGVDECLPNFQKINNYDTETCNPMSSLLGDDSTFLAVTTINGSKVKEDLYYREMTIDAINEVQSNNDTCPWIGYNLFKDGAKDGTYTFNNDEPTTPYWCFTESQ